MVSGPVRTIYVGGQDAVDADGNVVGVGDLAAQTAQILRNIKVALAAAGAGPEHARNAKARASQQEKKGNLTASEKSKIDRKADKVLGK